MLSRTCIAAAVLALFLAGPAIADERGPGRPPVSYVDTASLTISSDFTVSVREDVPEDADGDAEALARMLLAWIAAKTSLAVPEPPRIELVPEYHMRHLFDAAADPDQQPRADLPTSQGAGGAHQTSRLLAFYRRDTATVYLPKTWRPGGLRDQSILLHELVHHVQRFSKVVPACPGALERQAYELQATWLREQGVAGPYELIGTDEFTVLVLSACMPPDE
jgi:hypothetical protein